MSAAFFPQVQKIYVAYYGRPAEPAGLQYWAGQLAANGGNLTSIINAFGNSPESTALYAGSDNAAKVTAIYQAMFNRAPDAPGLAFYTAELTAGRMTAASIALNVANGAQGTDATVLNNKVSVASFFTDQVTADNAAVIAYSGSAAANSARSLISGITNAATTTNVSSTISSIKASGGSSVGQTFTLTSNPDVLAGTLGNDTFTAPGSTLRNDDVVVDSSSNDKDTLNITLNGADIAALNAGAAGTGPTISRIENVNINIDAFNGTATTIDARNISPAGTTLTLSSTNAGFDGVAGVVAARGVNVTAGAGVAVLTVDNLSTGVVDAGSAARVTVTADAARTDTIRLKVNGDVALNHVAQNGIRNAQIEATKNAVIDLRTTAAPAGDIGNLGLAAAGANGLITTSGAGNITLRAAGTQLDGRFVNHTGSGTLSVRVAETDSVDLQNFTNLTQLITGNPAAGTGYTGTAIVKDRVSITPRPGATSYAGATFNNAEGNIALVQDDQLNVTLGGANNGAMTFGGFQKVNFTQSGSQTFTGAILQNLTSANGAVVADVTSLNFKGAGDLRLQTSAPAVAGISGTGLIDASGITGGLTYTAPADAQAVMGGASSNVITASATGSLAYTGKNGGDTIVADISTGVVTINTGSGADVVSIATANATTGAVNGVVPTTGVVSATLGAGNDLVTVGLSASSQVVTAAPNTPQIIGTSTATANGKIVLDGGDGTDTLRLASGVVFYSDGGLLNTSNGNAGQTQSSIKGFERIELQEATGARAPTSPIDVTAGTFLLNGSDATVAVRYGFDAFGAAGTRFTVDDVAVASRLHLDDALTATPTNITARNVDLSKVKFDITRMVDQLIVDTAAGNDTIILPTTLANQQVRVDGGGGNDRIVVGDGPGIVNVILGAGSDTVDLTKSVSANVIVFANGTGAAVTLANQVTGTHTITGWKPQTLLDLDAFGTAGAFGGAATLGVLGNQAVSTANEVRVISTTGAAANLTLEGTRVISDFRSGEQLANYLAERYTIDAGGTDTGIYAINDTNSGSNKSYIWYLRDAGGGTAGALDAQDFTLLAVVENGGVGLTTANFTQIDQTTLIGLGAAAPTANIWVA